MDDAETLRSTIQQVVGQQGLVTRWIVIAEVAVSDGGFDLWHGAEGCAPWDIEGIASMGAASLIDSMTDDDDD